jgi:hypothetical protein
VTADVPSQPSRSLCAPIGRPTPAPSRRRAHRPRQKHKMPAPRTWQLADWHNPRGRLWTSRGGAPHPEGSVTETSTHPSAQHPHTFTQKETPPASAVANPKSQRRGRGAGGSSSAARRRHSAQPIRRDRRHSAQPIRRDRRHAARPRPRPLQRRQGKASRLPPEAAQPEATGTRLPRRCRDAPSVFRTG